jgi:primosomal protein N' (replication factor Y)
MNVYAEVAFPLPIPRTFSYLLPPPLRPRARVGVRVTAPFGRRRLTGFLVHRRLSPPPGTGPLKEILEILDEAPLLTPRFLAFTRRLSDYHFSSWGELLLAALPPSAGSRIKSLVKLTQAGHEALQGSALSPGERAAAEFLRSRAYTRAHLRRRFPDPGFPSLLLHLEKKGLVEFLEGKTVRPRPRPVAEVRPSGTGTQLPLDFSFGHGARSAAAAILKKVERRGFSISYLHGPDSDREAVYFHLAGRVLSSGGRALFLLPEISPSLGLVSKFDTKLGERAAILHSRLSEGRREAEWRKIQSGRASVVVGPRSALLAPVGDLRLLILDEEQDESFIQSENPAFDARQGVVFRARSSGAAAVLGSSAPSVGWFHRARTEGFLVETGGGGSRPRASVVDSSRESGLLSRALEDGLRASLSRGRLALVFLNRKGYASWLICPACRHVPRCPRCRIALTYHKREDRLACRYCSHAEPAPTRCPRCGERLHGGREAGIEALEEAVRRKFPAARVASFDSDAAGRPQDQVRILEAAENGKVDILLGTQLLAHQPRLPRAALIGIFNPETILSWADYRAGQRAYQDLERMMRVAEGGPPDAEVIIQTAMPDHPAIRAAASGDYEAFYKEEITYRRLMNYPPFSWMAEVSLQGPNLRSLAARVRRLHQRLGEAAPGVEVLGPARPSTSRLRGLSRVQLLLRAEKKERLDAALRECLRTAPVKAVRLYD